MHPWYRCSCQFIDLHKPCMWRRCRFCLGSNKVLKVALGKSETDEHKPNLHLMSERIKGSVGLFFTTMPRDKVVELFDTFEVPSLRTCRCRCQWDSQDFRSCRESVVCRRYYDIIAADTDDVQVRDFARAGAKATEDFELLEGPLEGPLGTFPHPPPTDILPCSKLLTFVCLPHLSGWPSAWANFRNVPPTGCSCCKDADTAGEDYAPCMWPLGESVDIDVQLHTDVQLVLMLTLKTRSQGFRHHWRSYDAVRAVVPHRAAAAHAGAHLAQARRPLQA